MQIKHGPLWSTTLIEHLIENTGLKHKFEKQTKDLYKQMQRLNLFRLTNAYKT